MTAKQAKRLRMGRPPKPAEQVRRNRVVVMLTDAELSKLQRLAHERALPFGTVAHEIIARALGRRS